MKRVTVKADTGSQLVPTDDTLMFDQTKGVSVAKLLVDDKRLMDGDRSYGGKNETQTKLWSSIKESIRSSLN